MVDTINVPSCSFPCYRFDQFLSWYKNCDSDYMAPNAPNGMMIHHPDPATATRRHMFGSKRLDPYPALTCAQPFNNLTFDNKCIHKYMLSL